ncbi:putative ubiquitin-like-specific protease 2B isoform X2 [Bidens hawaiensis]|uniref:putative ubiquitin-like-specific protease 2B isoform X2 n=1 Tax=Bidens hawaiensis TaxID=980011 RepID=UPI004048F728
MGTMFSNKKLNTNEYDFDVSVPAENPSRWMISPTDKKYKSHSATDKYTLLQSLAGGMDTRGKKIMNEALDVYEVGERANERVHRSNAALQSSSSNFSSKNLIQSKCSDYFTSHKSAIGKKDSDCSQRIDLTDTELVSIISDEDNENASTMSSDDFADAEGLLGEEALEHEITSQEKESSVVVNPECVTYGRSCYANAQLTFFCSSIKLDVSEEGATGCFTFEWKTENLISIESRWLESFIKAEVCLRIKSERSQKPGILEVKLTVIDSGWSNTQDLIKSLDEQYKEKWDVDLDSYELFEDITYLEGGCDSIAISKRDFQLLQPEKFLNDTIVDFYIEYLKKIKPAGARVHFFNSFFFRKLADFDDNQSRSIDFKEAFQRVRKWTKKVDIFQKDYIFIPVNFRLHWSLIIICHPGEVMNFTDDEMANSLKVPCILHMDSIKGSHRGLEQCIKCYLWEEWKERNSHVSENIPAKFKDLRFIRLEVPQQENSYDCGLFMLHYMELFLKQASNDFNPLNTFISADWFYPMEASLKRARIKRLIFELTKSNGQQGSSPKASYGLRDEDDDEEEADVQILNEACNSKETFDSASGTCDKSTDVAPLMVECLRSVNMDANMDGDIDGELSLVAENEQENHGQMVLYDPSIYDPSVVAVSPTKETDETEDFADQQEKSGGDKDMFESHVVEDSDDDVKETCYVEDSGSDNDSGDFYICDIDASSSGFKNVEEIVFKEETSKRRQMRRVVSGARKRLRKSS